MNGLGRRLAFLVGCMLGGCWMSHEPALLVDAGDSSAASEPDGGGWVPPAPTCPTDTPSLIIPPGPGCTSVRIREGRTIPNVWPEWYERRQAVHVVAHPDAMSSEVIEESVYFYLMGVGDARCFVGDNCRMSIAWDRLDEDCVDPLGGLSTGPTYFMTPVRFFRISLDGLVGEPWYFLILVKDGMEWILWGCVGEDEVPPGYTGEDDL